jgi:hemolysin activation/secretion protein
VNFLSRHAAPLLQLLLSLSSVAVQAQVTPPAPSRSGTFLPDSGSLLQQINPPMPQAPSHSGTGLRVEGQEAAELPDGASFEVSRIVISGNTLFDTASLRPLVADAEGTRLNLSQLSQVAGRITEYYRKGGYPLARAIIPAQTVRDGIVKIEVIEARYGSVKLDNRSHASTALMQETLLPLRSGQHVHQPELDRALLLLADIPGVVVGATLKPGDEVGTSNLEVEGDAAARVTGYATLDNYGDRSTGQPRAAGSVSAFNPFGRGDLFSVSALSSGEGLNYARVGYEAVLLGLGTRAGADLHAMRYELGDSFEPLGAHGRAQAGALWLKHPFVRARNVNLYGQAQYESRRLRDRVDAGAIRNDRHLDNWSLSFNGDWRADLLSGSVSTWSLGWTSGRLRFDDAAAQEADAASANTRGSFFKWVGSFSTAQALSAADTLYLAGNIQWTDQNLDSSEKISIGGPNSVRAYRLGAVSADSGYLATAELRHFFGAVAAGRWQGVAFVDTAHVTLNRSPWTNGANVATLTGAGLGFEWFGPQLWRVKASVASRLGSRLPVLEDSARTRGWVEVSKAF